MKAELPSRKLLGFTLIELLLVIAVLAILLLLTIPLAGTLRRTAQGAKCLGNIRQYGIALFSYAADKNGLKVWDISTPANKTATKPQVYKWLSEETAYLPRNPSLHCPLADGAAFDHVNGRYRFPYAPNIALCATYPQLKSFPVPASRVALVAEVNDWDGYESRTSLNTAIWRGGDVGQEGEPRPDRVNIARYHGSPERRGLHFFFADGSARLLYPTENDWAKAPTCAPTTGVATTGYFYHSSHYYNMKEGTLTAP